jgi:hypothetical protein
MYNFIQEADLNGESVLIVSLDSSVATNGIIIWYFLKRFYYF